MNKIATTFKPAEMKNINRPCRMKMVAAYMVFASMKARTSHIL